MNFQPVKFDSSKKVCPLPLAVTATRHSVVFRVSRALATEGKIKHGDLYSLYYDDGPALFALVDDAENKSGEARQMSASQKDKKIPQSFTVTFPRTDLVARIWKKEAKISGLFLFDNRGPGKIVFHKPTDKATT